MDLWRLCGRYRCEEEWETQGGVRAYSLRCG